MKINWQKPCKELDGQTPSEWLAENFPDSVLTRDVADRLAKLLNIEEDLVIRVGRRASAMGLRKTEEANRACYVHRGNVQRLPPRPAIKKFHDWPKVTADPCCVTSDWHIPYYNERFVARMFTICQHWKPPVKNLIVAGDFVDFEQFSIYVPERDGQVGRTTEDTCQDAEDLLNGLAEWFEMILLLRGNHENRLYTKELDQELSYDRAMRVVGYVPEKIVFSKWPWCELNGKWRITHPKAYRQNPGSLARRLAEKHHQHVMMAHGHNCQISQDVSGQYICIDSGGMMDPERMGYYVMEDTAHPIWRPAFWIIHGDKVHGFNDLWTDWTFYREMLGIPLGW